jgi:hypothetical protein
MDRDMILEQDKNGLVGHIRISNSLSLHLLKKCCLTRAYRHPVSTITIFTAVFQLLEEMLLRNCISTLLWSIAEARTKKIG